MVKNAHKKVKINLILLEKFIFVELTTSGSQLSTAVLNYNNTIIIIDKIPGDI